MKVGEIWIRKNELWEGLIVKIISIQWVEVERDEWIAFEIQKELDGFVEGQVGGLWRKDFVERYYKEL